MQSEDIQASNASNQEVINNKSLSIFEACIPILLLVGMLAYNIFIFGDSALAGSNQFILLLGGAIAGLVGWKNKVSFKQMLEEIANNIKSTTGGILILLMVGALSGTWMISGIIPTMIYYGLQILSPEIFLAASLVICSMVSLATGSSWSTSATVGIALIGIGQSLGIPAGYSAGAVISGAYFGDKISPLSDTTNLASAMAGADLFDHIKYMIITTVPSIIIALIVFLIMGLNIDITSEANITDKLDAISSAFTISPALF
jgi:Na+:H+ antiporter, NhaC family